MPDSPITLSADEISEARLTEQIQQFLEKGKFYTDEDIQTILSSKEDCNKKNQARRERIKEEIKKYSKSVMELYHPKGVSSLQSELEGLEKDLKAAKQSLEQNIGEIEQFGIYAVLLKNINPSDSTITIINRAQAALELAVIEDLNGVHIERLTKVTDFDTVQDIIKSLVEGEVNFTPLFPNQQPDYRRLQFVYFVKARVAPLSEKQLSQQHSDFDTDASIIDLNTDLNDILRDYPNKRDKLRAEIDKAKRQNQLNFNRQRELIEKNEAKIRSLENDIDTLRLELAKHIKSIKAVCRKYNFDFDSNDLDNSTQYATDVLEQRISRSEKEKRTLEEQIIEQEEGSTGEIGYGKPADAISTKSIELYSRLRELGKKHSLRERLMITNLEVSDYDFQKNVTYFKRVEKIWVYPVGDKNGKFKVYVFAKFKMIERKTFTDNTFLALRDAPNLRKAMKLYDVDEKEQSKIYCERAIVNEEIIVSEAVIKEISTNINIHAFFLDLYSLPEEITLYEKVIKILEQEANKENVEAQHLLGMLYFMMTSAMDEISYNLGAASWLQKSLENSYTKNTMLLDWSIVDIIDWSYHSLYTFEIEEQSPAAQQALSWYKKDVDNGDSKAMYNLAIFWKDVLDNNDKAIFWLTKSAEAGNSKAMCKLANLSKWNGDKDKARYWYTKAAKTGEENNTCGNCICKLAQFILDEGLDTDEAISWYIKGIAKGDFCAMRGLGDIYVNPNSKHYNLDEAVYWFEEAAKQRVNRSLMHELGKIYRNPDCTCYDINTSLDWHFRYAKSTRRKIRRKYRFYLVNIAQEYIDQDDFDTAMKFFQKADELGQLGRKYQYRIGQWYDMGIGMSINRKKAVHWYKKAAVQGHEEAQKKLDE